MRGSRALRRSSQPSSMQRGPDRDGCDGKLSGDNSFLLPLDCARKKCLVPAAANRFFARAASYLQTGAAGHWRMARQVGKSGDDRRKLATLAGAKQSTSSGLSAPAADHPTVQHHCQALRFDSARKKIR